MHTVTPEPQSLSNREKILQKHFDFFDKEHQNAAYKIKECCRLALPRVKCLGTGRAERVVNALTLRGLIGPEVDSGWQFYLSFTSISRVKMNGTPPVLKQGP